MNPFEIPTLSQQRAAMIPYEAWDEQSRRNILELANNARGDSMHSLSESLAREAEFLQQE